MYISFHYWINLTNLEGLEHWESPKRWMMRSLSIESRQWTVLVASDKPLVVFTTTHYNPSFRPSEMKSMRFAIECRISCSPVGSMYNGIWTMLFQAWMLRIEQTASDKFVYAPRASFLSNSVVLIILGKATFIWRIELHYTDSKSVHFSKTRNNALQIQSSFHFLSFKIIAYSSRICFSIIIQSIRIRIKFYTIKIS